MRIFKLSFLLFFLILSACGVFTNSNKKSTSVSSDTSLSEASLGLEGNSNKAKNSQGKVKKIDDFDLVKYQYCGNASECTPVINGCCDCANGGEEVAINKSRLEEFKNQFDCIGEECGILDANPVCGSGVVSCINHRCKYYASVE